MKTCTAPNPFMLRIVAEGSLITITPTRKRLGISDIEHIFLEAIRQVELGQIHILLDFSEVEWVCASTAGFLLELDRRLSNRGGSLKLKGVPDEMRQVLKMMQLEHRFEILDSAVPLRNAG